MPQRAERLEKLKRLEFLLESPLLVYVTSTRVNTELIMGMDSIRVFWDHLRELPKLEWLNLFLHSNGGDPSVPWKLIPLLRERAARLRVLVPHHAFSAATLTALGADEILMHPMAMLGPTDISINGAYNPRDATGQSLPISGEEVLAYIALVKEDAGINHEEELAAAFDRLASNVHPLALGAVKRSHSQSRMIARKLLETTAQPFEAHRLEEIVSNLTSRLYYHGHPINRIEAKQLGLRITEPPEEVEPAMWDLYEEYERVMRLREPYSELRIFEAAHPGLQANETATMTHTLIRGYIESKARCDVYATDLLTQGTRDANGVLGTGSRIEQEGWREEAD